MYSKLTSHIVIEKITLTVKSIAYVTYDVSFFIIVISFINYNLVSQILFSWIFRNFLIFLYIHFSFLYSFFDNFYDYK